MIFFSFWFKGNCRLFPCQLPVLFSYLICLSSLKLSFLKLVLMLPGRRRRRTEHSRAGALHLALVETGQQQLQFSSALLRKCSLCVRERERYSEKHQKNAFLASDLFFSFTISCSSSTYFFRPGMHENVLF